VSIRRPLIAGPLVQPIAAPLGRGALPWESGGGGPSIYSPGYSAIQLPFTAIWISTSGLTLADGDSTVNSWLAGWGGIRPTLTAPASTNRPAYTAGAVPTITSDGVDNYLRGTFTKGSDFTSVESGYVGSRVAFGATGDNVCGYGIPSSPVLVLQDALAASSRAVTAAAGNPASTTDPDGVTAHYSFDHPGGTAPNNIRRAGAIEASGTSGALTTRVDGGLAFIGAHPYNGTAATNSTFHAFYLGPALTADQRTYLRALLTYHTGVAS